VRAAFAFLTVLGRRGATPDSRTVPWFPVVGVVVGAVVGFVRWGATAWWGDAVAAALAVVADLALTGMLHVDGLADAADGLLPPLPAARRLAVMRAPDVGAFGVATVAAVLLLRAVALAAVPAGPEAVVACATVWAAGRAAMGLALVTRPYVGGGLGAAFRRTAPGGASAAAVAGTGAAAVVAGAVLAPTAGLVALAVPVAVIAVVVAAVVVVVFAERRLGGITGDVLGAAGVVAETVGVLAVAARW
jgi:adenosylcobinamide-GDP ribazoletransferase